MHLHTTCWFVFLMAGFASFSEEHRESNETQVSYEGAQVWRSTLGNGDHVGLINKLVDELAISPWHLKSTHADFLVHASTKGNVTNRLLAQGINHTVLIEDVGQLLNTLQQPFSPSWTKEALRMGHRYDFNEFHTLEVIQEYLSYIEEEYTSICTVMTIGRTAENRPIKMIKVSNHKPGNKGILLAGGQHGREWGSVSSVMYVLQDLLTNFTNLPNYITVNDWYIIPIENVDGFDYSQKTDRLWRKNRKKFEKCVGVDLNRNYGFNWYVEGVTSQDPCLSTYAGEHAFSEPETIAVNKVIQDASKNLVAFVNVHAYGQLVLYPWASIFQPMPQQHKHSLLAEEMTMAIFNSMGVQYDYGFAYYKAEPASGTSLDYAFATGVRYSFAIETRDSGRHGFLITPDEILPAAKEVQTAVYALCRALEHEQ